MRSIIWVWPRPIRWPPTKRNCFRASPMATENWPDIAGKWSDHSPSQRSGSCFPGFGEVDSDSAEAASAGLDCPCSGFGSSKGIGDWCGYSVRIRIAPKTSDRPAPTRYPSWAFEFVASQKLNSSSHSIGLVSGLTWTRIAPNCDSRSMI